MVNFIFSFIRESVRKITTGGREMNLIAVVQTFIFILILSIFANCEEMKEEDDEETEAQSTQMNNQNEEASQIGTRLVSAATGLPLAKGKVYFQGFE